MKLKKIISVITVIAVIATVFIGCGKGKNLEWPTSGLAKELPTPVSTKGEITDDSADHFAVKLYKVEKSDYDSYISDVKKKGFSTEPTEEGDNYSAFNKSGYKFEGKFNADDKEMTIELYAPRGNGELVWPSSGLAEMLPEPYSSKGEIKTDSSDKFLAYVGDTTVEDYGYYVEDCINEYGFKVDYQKEKKSFSAKNKKGYSLTVKYEGVNVMSVELNAPFENESETTSTTAQKAAEKAKTTKKDTASKSKDKSDDEDWSNVTPEFKETMDKYEEFFDEYIAFMKKYEKSNNTAAMMKEYAKYMKKYSEVMEKINEIDQDELSADDLAYYTYVWARISEKLEKV